MKLLVTGGAGFIGSCFVRMALAEAELPRLCLRQANLRRQSGKLGAGVKASRLQLYTG